MLPAFWAHQVDNRLGDSGALNVAANYWFLPVSPSAHAMFAIDYRVDDHGADQDLFRMDGYFPLDCRKGQVPIACNRTFGLPPASHI
jgi:hypothetical protein